MALVPVLFFVAMMLGFWGYVGLGVLGFFVWSVGLTDGRGKRMR